MDRNEQLEQVAKAAQELLEALSNGSQFTKRAMASRQALKDALKNLKEIPDEV